MPDTLTHNGTQFLWQGGYDTRHLPKHAGFCWDPARKTWWTNDATQAQRLSAYADDAAHQAFGATQERIAASRAEDAMLEAPCPDGIAYLPYQRAGIAYAAERNTLFADEMGLGKTVEALGVANLQDAQSILIICPASLRINWFREAEKWLCRLHTYHVIEGGTDVPSPDATCVIVNYDVLNKAAIKAALMARQWQVLIADEAHYLKSGAKAQRAVVVLGKEEKGKLVQEGLLHCAERVVFLTGTPILNKPVELWPLVHALDPATFGNFFTYGKRYCDAKQIDIGRRGLVWDFTGDSHLDELQEKARASCMVRRLKKDVLQELPPKRRQVIELPQNGARTTVAAEVAAWDAKESRLVDLRDAVALAHASGDQDAYTAAVARLRDDMQVAFMEIARLRHETAVAKAPKVAEHVVGMLDSGLEKLVLFAHHHDVVRLLHETIEAAGYTVVIVTGETPLAARQAAVDAFQAPAGPHVFLGNIQAAGVGITLTAASTVVFAELDWVPANITQAEDRTHRLGQTASVLVQHLVFDGSLDARMAKTLVAKQAIADAALDDTPLVLAEPLLPSETPESPAARRPQTYPVATDAQRAAALAGVRLLTDLNPDGTRERNAVGWNRIDAYLGSQLAQCVRLTDGQTWLATKLLTKYRRTQLPNTVTAVLWPEDPA